MMSMAFHVGYIAGPSVGGLLVDTLGWRWTFFMISPLALYGGLHVLEDSSRVGHRARRSDDRSFGHVGAFAGCGVGHPRLAASRQIRIRLIADDIVSVRGLCVWLLLRVEAKASAPLLDLSLFKIRMLTAAVLSHFFVVITHASTFFLLPFFLQGILHISPTRVGLTMILFSLVIVCLAPIGGWLGDKLGSRLLCTVGSVLTALSMVGFARLNGESTQFTVMLSLMLLGLGWSCFQSPNLSAMFNAAGPRHVGSVSGLSLTSANVGNAMGVAVGSLLFLRWLNYYGLEGAVVPPYTEWGASPEMFIKSFQNAWLVIAALGSVAIITSAMRGRERKKILE
jgi:predicted MFS family arabinose efflux permease